jgi:hypothetical protein
MESRRRLDNHRACEFFGLRHPLQRMEIGHERLFVGSVVHPAIHSGLDRAREDCIDANARPVIQLGSKCLGHVRQADLLAA